MTKINELSDFWWSDSDEIEKYKYVYFCYQEPYSDEYHSDKTPNRVSRYFGLDSELRLTKEKKYYPIDYISFWKQYNNSINVSRSFGLYNKSQSNDILYGPFLLDIDREDSDIRGYIQDIKQALEDVRILIKQYLNTFTENEYRIFFTGHKGFHIEVRPDALNIGKSENRYKKFTSIRKEINSVFGDHFIDRMHDEIRLHNSINRWIRHDGKIMNRMNFEISLNDIDIMNAEDICIKSEVLAREYLSDKI